MIRSLPNVIFAIQLAVMESNQRHSHKEKAERFHVLNLKVIHKFNFYFSLALNLGMVINYVYSLLSHDFAKTIMELVSFIHLGCNKCRLAKGFLFTFFFSLHFSPQLSTSFKLAGLRHLISTVKAKHKNSILDLQVNLVKMRNSKTLTFCFGITVHVSIYP